MSNGGFLLIVPSASRPCYPRRRRNRRFRARFPSVTHKARLIWARLRRPLCSFSVAVAMRFITPVLRHGGNTVRTGAQYVRHRTPRRNDIQIFVCFCCFLPSWLDFLGAAVSAYLLLSLVCHVKSLSSTAISLGVMAEEQTRSVSTYKSNDLRMSIVVGGTE
jgi:hypothetical protein